MVTTRSVTVNLASAPFPVRLWKLATFNWHVGLVPMAEPDTPFQLAGLEVRARRT